MSNIMKPSPDYCPPPVPGDAPDDARMPGYSQRPRSSYRWVWVVIGIFALLCMLGGALVWAFAVSPVGGPTIASDQYYTAIRDRDYAKAYSYLGSDLQASLSQQAFTQAAQQRDAAEGRVTHYAYQNIPVGSPTPVTLTVTRTDGITYTVHLELRQEGGAWKITAFDRI